MKRPQNPKVPRPKQASWTEVLGQQRRTTAACARLSSPCWSITPTRTAPGTLGVRLAGRRDMLVIADMLGLVVKSLEVEVLTRASQTVKCRVRKNCSE
jgi:hypothetical protein